MGASLSTFFAGVVVGAYGPEVAYLALALAGTCGLLLLWFGMPETRRTAAE